jgi:hypothetical protein
MIPEIRHALVTDILLAGHWYAVIDNSYTQRGEMFNARLSEFPERSGTRLTASEVSGRLTEIQAWKFKQN